MENANTIRENAKHELGQWFANQLRKEVADVYRFARSFGLLAKDAIEFARMIVQSEVNGFLKSNFHSHIPK